MRRDQIELLMNLLRIELNTFQAYGEPVLVPLKAARQQQLAYLESLLLKLPDPNASTPGSSDTPPNSTSTGPANPVSP